MEINKEEEEEKAMKAADKGGTRARLPRLGNDAAIDPVNGKRPWCNQLLQIRATHEGDYPALGE